MNNQKAAPLMNENIQVQQDMKEMPHFMRYDEGLKEFIKNFFVGDVVIAPVDNFWEFYVKNTESDIKFPAISLYPVDYTLANEQNNFATIQLGSFFQPAAEIVDEATNVKLGNTMNLSKAVRALYWNITYQINVWALTRDTALQLVQEIMFPLFQHKEFQIKYFNDKYSVPYTISDSITNQSSIGMNSANGTIYNYAFTLVVTGPIFDSKNYYNVINRDLQLFTHLGEEKID